MCNMPVLYWALLPVPFCELCISFCEVPFPVGEHFRPQWVCHSFQSDVNSNCVFHFVICVFHFVNCPFHLVGNISGPKAKGGHWCHSDSFKRERYIFICSLVILPSPVADSVFALFLLLAQSPACLLSRNLFTLFLRLEIGFFALPLFLVGFFSGYFMALLLAIYAFSPGCIFFDFLMMFVNDFFLHVFVNWYW